MTSVVPIFANTIGQIFQPLLKAMAWLMAFFYSLIPNYAVAIALLTVVVMIVTAPLTVKSTRSMSAMQRLAPEMKKLQAKYKGDKQTLNEEMMKLYREHGVNPMGGCLPMLIQFPVFIILYDVIKGLINTVKVGNKTVPAPRYIGHGTKLYASLLHHNGSMPAFGINLAAKVLGHHSVLQALPYASLILVAIGLQYFQMRQLNSRNPQMAQANPQAMMMQRYMPLLFAIIYINIAAGVNIYFIVSSLCRIGIQAGVFRAGLLKPAAADGSAEVLPGRGGKGAGAPRRRTVMERLAEAQKKALDQQAQQQGRRAEIEQKAGTGSDAKPRPGKGPSASVIPKKPTTDGPKPTGQTTKKPAGSVAPKKPTTDGPKQRPLGNGEGPAREVSDEGGDLTGPQTHNVNGSSSPNGSPEKNGDQPSSKAKRDRGTR